VSLPDAATADDEELFARLGHLVIDHDNKNFYRGWLRHELLINRCGDCGHWRHPPRPVCPRCWSFDVVPTRVSGRGVIFMLTFLHYGPALEGVDYSGPGHPVAVVELEEQPNLRFTSTVVDWEPGQLSIGVPVELTWITRLGAPFPAFRPVPGAALERR
jgi:uncharacterized OB-fold protein